MANWRGLFHSTKNLPSSERARSETQLSVKAVKAQNRETEEKAAFALNFVDTLSELETQLHTSDDPKEIAQGAMQVACEFYQADWCGFLEVDMELSLWSPFWWYNIDQDDRTARLTDEFESASQSPRWATAMRENKCVSISNVEKLKESDPEEYSLYQRFLIDSVLAVPVKPRPVGFLAVRNPKRFVNDERMLRMLAYVVLNAINQYRYLERTRMTLAPEAIKNDKDVIFNLFGELNIYTAKGVLKEHDCKSPKCCRIIVYLLLHRRTTHPAQEIASVLWPEDTAVSPEAVCTNIRGMIYRFRQAFDLISDYPLIEATPNGYRINPELNVMTDVQKFDALWETAQSTATTSQKVDLIKQAISIYKGPLFEEASHEHWIMPLVHTYNLRYIGLVNDLLVKLAEAGDYAVIHQYATRALDITPENIKARFWLLYSMYQSGAIEMAKSELARTEMILSDEEYDVLQRYLKRAGEISPTRAVEEEL